MRKAEMSEQISELNNRNIGLWFYKVFIRNYLNLPDSKKKNEKELENWVKKETKPFLKLYWQDYSQASYNCFDNTNLGDKVQLKTIYPGLVCGIGYEHEVGFSNEFKLGFSFDHTTGLPYIPGSSVKGTLRSAFKHNGYPKSILEDWIEAIKIPDSGKSCPDEFKDSTNELQIVVDQTDWQKLEDHIFGGKNYTNGEAINSYQTDVFFDAFISGNKNDNDFFLADDYITCHQNRKDASLSPFTNPTPVRFLKVRSDVEFTFGFRLFETKIKEGVIFTSAIKRELFKQILLDLGIGAKTNVGYGQFESV